MREIKSVLSGRRFLECPRWHDGQIWVSDLYAGEVLAMSPSGGDLRVVAQIAGQPSGLGWLPDGRLLIMSMTDRKILRMEASGEIVVHADLSDKTRWWLVDMVVDGRTGHAYLGDVGFAAPESKEDEGNLRIAETNVFVIGPNGWVTPYGAGIRVPNGMAISADGSTLVIAETYGARITAFGIGEDGSLHNQRIWADFNKGCAPDTLSDYNQAGIPTPDGICFDADGALWVADPYGRRAIRVREGGEILDEVRHSKMISAVALGGADGRTLFLTVADSANRDESLLSPTSELLSTRVNVPSFLPASVRSP